MSNEKVKYALSARYLTADIYNTEAVDTFMEIFAKEFTECLLCLNYDTEVTGVKGGIINVDLIVEVDNTRMVPTFPTYIRSTTDCATLMEDSCDAEVIR